ncbi:MAG TPA: hypothetical protein VFK31_01795 [Rhodanobacteraceae bacterium]|nr:hypothetical protein [Rhodanobacteraceae bacterium]
MNDEDLQRSVDQRLADATSRVIAKARAHDRENVDRLIRARGASFGIGTLILGTGLIGIAVLVHERYPHDTPLIVLFAVMLWIVGGIFVDMPNWLRKKLAKQLMNRSSDR